MLFQNKMSLPTPRCQKILKNNRQCLRNVEVNTNFCWQHQNLLIRNLQIEFDFSSETDLIILSYLPINEALNLTKSNQNLQIKLVSIYFADNESLNSLIKLKRFDLVKILFDKNIGDVITDNEEEFYQILDLIRTNTRLKDLKIQLMKRSNVLGLQLIDNVKNFKLLFDALSENKSVTSLEIDPSNPITFSENIDEFIDLINKRKFEDLYISNILNNFSDEDIDYLFGTENFNSLKLLDISYNSLTTGVINTLFEFLKDNTSLTSINLSHNYIRDHSIKFLSEALEVNSTLRSINLNNNDIKNEGVELLAKSLKINSSLKIIDLCNNEIGIKGAQFLAEALKINHSLTSIDISYNSINKWGIEYLAEALKINQTLTSINLGGNYVKEQGAQYLAEALKINNSLTFLNLHSTEINDDGNALLAESLKVNQTLTLIDLSSNDIGYQGINSLAKALTINHTLKLLNLNDNYIEKEGANLLAETLKINNLLTSLDLGHNIIQNSGANSIMEALKINSSITYINLSHNEIKSSHPIKTLSNSIRTIDLKRHY